MAEYASSNIPIYSTTLPTTAGLSSAYGSYSKDIGSIITGGTNSFLTHPPSSDTNYQTSLQIPFKYSYTPSYPATTTTTISSSIVAAATTATATPSAISKEIPLSFQSTTHQAPLGSAGNTYEQIKTNLSQFGEYTPKPYQTNIAIPSLFSTSSKSPASSSFGLKTLEGTQATAIDLKLAPKATTSIPEYVNYSLKQSPSFGISPALTPISSELQNTMVTTPGITNNNYNSNSTATAAAAAVTNMLPTTFTTYSNQFLSQYEPKRTTTTQVKQEPMAAATTTTTTTPTSSSGVGLDMKSEYVLPAHLANTHRVIETRMSQQLKQLPFTTGLNATGNNQISSSAVPNETSPINSYFYAYKDNYQQGAQTPSSQNATSRFAPVNLSNTSVNIMFNKSIGSTISNDSIYPPTYLKDYVIEKEVESQNTLKPIKQFDSQKFTTIEPSNIQVLSQQTYQSTMTPDIFKFDPIKPIEPLSSFQNSNQYTSNTLSNNHSDIKSNFKDVKSTTDTFVQKFDYLKQIQPNNLNNNLNELPKSSDNTFYSINSPINSVGAGGLISEYQFNSKVQAAVPTGDSTQKTQQITEQQQHLPMSDYIKNIIQQPRINENQTTLIENRLEVTQLSNDKSNLKLEDQLIENKRNESELIHKIKINEGEQKNVIEQNSSYQIQPEVVPDQPDSKIDEEERAKQSIIDDQREEEQIENKVKRSTKERESTENVAQISSTVVSVLQPEIKNSDEQKECKKSPPESDLNQWMDPDFQNFVKKHFSREQKLLLIQQLSQQVESEVTEEANRLDKYIEPAQLGRRISPMKEISSASEQAEYLQFSNSCKVQLESPLLSRKKTFVTQENRVHEENTTDHMNAESKQLLQDIYNEVQAALKKYDYIVSMNSKNKRKQSQSQSLSNSNTSSPKNNNALENKSIMKLQQDSIIQQQDSQDCSMLQQQQRSKQREYSEEQPLRMKRKIESGVKVVIDSEESSETEKLGESSTRNMMRISKMEESQAENMYNSRKLEIHKALKDNSKLKRTMQSQHIQQKPMNYSLVKGSESHSQQQQQQPLRSRNPSRSGTLSLKNSMIGGTHDQMMLMTTTMMHSSQMDIRTVGTQVIAEVIPSNSNHNNLRSTSAAAAAAAANIATKKIAEQSQIFKDQSPISNRGKSIREKSIIKNEVNPINQFQLKGFLNSIEPIVKAKQNSTSNSSTSVMAISSHPIPMIKDVKSMNLGDSEEIEQIEKVQRAARKQTTNNSDSNSEITQTQLIRPNSIEDKGKHVPSCSKKKATRESLQINLISRGSKAQLFSKKSNQVHSENYNPSQLHHFSSSCGASLYPNSHRSIERDFAGVTATAAATTTTTTTTKQIKRPQKNQIVSQKPFQTANSESNQISITSQNRILDALAASPRVGYTPNQIELSQEFHSTASGQAVNRLDLNNEQQQLIKDAGQNQFLIPSSPIPQEKNHVLQMKRLAILSDIQDLNKLIEKESISSTSVSAIQTNLIINSPKLSESKIRSESLLLKQQQQGEIQIPSPLASAQVVVPPRIPLGNLQDQLDTPAQNNKRRGVVNRNYQGSMTSTKKTREPNSPQSNYGYASIKRENQAIKSQVSQATGVVRNLENCENELAHHTISYSSNQANASKSPASEHTPLNVNIYRQQEKQAVQQQDVVPKGHSSAASGSFHERNRKWLEETKTKKEIALRNSNSQEMRECTFKPTVRKSETQAKLQPQVAPISVAHASEQTQKYQEKQINSIANAKKQEQQLSSPSHQQALMKSARQTQMSSSSLAEDLARMQQGMQSPILQRYSEVEFWSQSDASVYRAINDIDTSYQQELKKEIDDVLEIIQGFQATTTQSNNNTKVSPHNQRKIASGKKSPNMTAQKLRK